MPKLENSPHDLATDRRRVPQVALSVLSLLLLSLGLPGAQNKTQRETAPPRLRKAIGCLVAADYIQQFGLEPIGLKVGDLAWVRYEIGSIPGTGGDTPGLWNIIMYSQNGRRGTLLFADPNHRSGFEAVLNGYNLAKRGSRWTADGGQGGFHVYEAIGRYVTALSRRPRYRVRLLPGGPECTQQEN